MEKKNIVIGIGELLWDVLPSGKKAGGAPFNFAYHASKAGAEGYGISAIGNDKPGDELLGEIQKNGIRHLLERVGYPTGTVQVELHEGIPRYTIRENVAWDYIPLTKEMEELASKADAICFGSLAQRNAVSRNTTRSVLRLIGKDAYKLYDINLRPPYYSEELIEESLLLANSFKINEEELGILKSLFSLDMENDRACRWIMSQFDLKLCILTAGDSYSTVYTPAGKSTIPTPKVKVVDTVGAGDCFSGILIARLLRGEKPEAAHRQAVEASAYVCSSAGAWVYPPRGFRKVGD